MSCKAQEQGFNLIELLITMTMAAILLSIAIPSFSHMLKKHRVLSDQRALQAELSTARALAIETNTVVTICAKSASTLTCNGSDDWSEGWLVFIDDGSGTSSANSANGVLDGTEELIRVYETKANNSIVLMDEPSGDDVKTLSFNQRGYLYSINNDEQQTFLFCEPDKDSKYARAIFVELTGRALASRDSDNNDVHNDLSGGDFSC
ncbi:GspH/FimT family pseudopilin [Agaribacterium sp. ZY112]|uniref:GspH/FimT family pseudopilin n=1 Tax=Agaribacterium sp. ZY112 TaxID=3233574 RepID=UPI00352658CD